ncbi:MAG: site-specific integrase [Lachnospiraceae bacterium]|nr:site-specific integrase [Lachnospiraceae bacterium]
MDSNITFGQLSEVWIEAKRKLVKHSSLCAYNLALTTHILPVFANSTIIAEEDVQKFVLDKLTSGLSRQSVRNIYAILKAIVRFGSKRGIYQSPEWEIEFPTVTTRRSLPVLSTAHHKKLLRHLTQQPTVDNIGILLALCTGMRIGEVCALQWKHVDFKRRIIFISQTLGRIYNVETKSTERTLSSPKSKTSNREIPISKELFAALKSIRGKTDDDCFVLGCNCEPKEPRSYRDYFTRLLVRLNIPKIVFHGLRHTFATRSIECGCDYKTVSVILGHSNVATTMNLYVHPNYDQKKRCIDRLSKYLTIR